MNMKVDLLKSYNFEKTCAICLSTLVDSVRNYVLTSRLRDNYANLVGFEIVNDISLCFICNSLVHKFFKFQRKCRQSLELIARIQRHPSQQSTWNYPNDQIYCIMRSELLSLNTNEIDDETTLLDSARYLEKSSGIWSKGPKIKSEIEEILKPDNVKIEYSDYEEVDSSYHGADNELIENGIDTTYSEIDNKSNGICDKKKKSKKRKHRMKIDLTAEEEGSENDESQDPLLLSLNMRAILLSHEEQLNEIKNRLRSKQYINSTFKCDRCGTGFSYRDSYESHLTRHDRSIGGEHECLVCGVRFPSVRTLWSHRSNHRRRYECSACGKRVTQRRDCISHRASCPNQSPYKARQDKQHTCDICGKISRSEYSLKRHRRRAHFAKRNHHCHLCDQTFVNIQALRDHLIVHSGERPFACNECLSSFPTKSRLQQHLTTHIASRDFYCPTCDICFPTQRRLNTHLKVGARHIAPQLLRHECSKCDRRFYTLRSLQLHSDRVHLNVLRYSCAECPRAYSAPNALVLHMRKAHPDKAPARKRYTITKEQGKKYICDFCGAAFASTSILTCHMRRHTGERPLQCPHCEARFAYPSARYTHIRLVHLKLKRSKKSDVASKKDTMQAIVT